MANLDDIRKKLQEMEQRKGGNRKFPTGVTYPFWNIPENEAAVLRFLPDADQSNTFFWRERQLINLKFPGIKGQDEGKSVVVKVPCMEMWNEACPILAEVRPMWNDKSLEDTAREYWKKRSFMFQGFVTEDPLNEDEKPENPIRRFILGPQIFNIVKDALLDPEMENIPVDYLNGTNFRITRTKKGQYADYSTSKWARNETALTEEQLEAIEKFGLNNLNDWLPAKPDTAALNAISEMFEASVDGELYDPERWATYYRPYGLEFDASDDNDSSTETTGVKATSTVSADLSVNRGLAASTKTEEVVEKTAPEVKAESSSKSAQDILAKIRNRANAE